MDCIFCKIVKGEIPSKKIYENEDVVAFLDINPGNPGHTLVVPRKHSSNIYDTDDKTLAVMAAAAKKIAQQMRDKMDAKGVNVVQNNGKFAGQIVDHIHFHVIPRFENDFVVISYKRVQLDDEKMEHVRKTLEIKEKSDYDYFR